MLLATDASPNHIQNKMKMRGETDFTLFHLSVAVPGLEPRLREPESRVLPLHHTAEKKLLPHRDSNSVKQNQNLVCYHYTMGQSANQTRLIIVLRAQR